MVPPFSSAELSQAWLVEGGLTPRGALAPRGVGLPCLKGNNSIRVDEAEVSKEANPPNEEGCRHEISFFPSCPPPDPINQTWRLVSPYHAKMAFALKFQIEQMCKRHGIEKIGFLTLTFKDNVQDLREAQRRYNSLASNFLREHYPEFITAVERQMSGRVHFHLVVVLADGIREGFNFEEVNNKSLPRKLRYQSANPFLKAEWALWRKTAPIYGFGRTELTPIKSSALGIANYMGAYIAKNVGARQYRDKGRRMFRVSKEAQKASTRFMFHSERTKLWRNQLASWAAYRGIDKYEQLAERLGGCWAWFFGDAIMAFETPLSCEGGSNKVVPGPSSREEFHEMAIVDGKAPQSRQESPGRVLVCDYDLERDSVFMPRPGQGLKRESATLKASAVRSTLTKEPDELPTKCGAERRCLDTG